MNIETLYLHSGFLLLACSVMISLMTSTA